MKKTLTINQITESLRRSSMRQDLICRLNSLKSDCDTTNINIVEFIPVKIISCVEEFFRQIYRDIINDKKFRKNLKNVKCLKDMKFDYYVVDAFMDYEITLGDYISYFFPCNRIADIDCNLSEMLDMKFLDKLKNFDNSWNVDEDIKIIEKVFKFRHIICHESATPNFKESEITKMIDCSIDFLMLVDNFIINILHPNVSLTQCDMNMDSCEEFNNIDKKLQLFIELITTRTRKTNFPADFDYMKSWKEYREEKARSASSMFNNSSIYPLIYNNSLTQTTIQKINELKQEFYYLHIKEEEYTPN